MATTGHLRVLDGMEGCGICRMNRLLAQDPFTAPLDKFIKHDAQISQCKAAHVEAKELGCMTCAKLQTDVG